MKRRSSTKEQLEPNITFFADRNLGRKFIEILRSGGLDVEAHFDHFPENDTEKEKDDRQWIRKCAENGWVAFSGDKAIARNYAEIAEVMTSGAEMFVPQGKKHPTEFAELVLRTLTRIQKHVKRRRKWKSRPFISKIGFNVKDSQKPGEVYTWITKKNWLEKTKKRSG